MAKSSQLEILRGFDRIIIETDSDPPVPIVVIDESGINTTDGYRTHLTSEKD